MTKIAFAWMLRTRVVVVGDNGQVFTLREWISSGPANTTHRPNAGPMLGQRRRRWANIGPALGRCVVFAGGDTMGGRTVQSQKTVTAFFSSKQPLYVAEQNSFVLLRQGPTTN